MNGRRVYLVRIARIQRTLIWLTLGLLGCYAGLGGGVAVLRQLNAPPTAAKALLAGAGTLALMVAALGMVQTARLAVAAGKPGGIAFTCALLMLIPAVGPLVLMLVNTSATKILQRCGARVGFLGVSAMQMRALVLGACPTCGYDIRGLPAPVCPECGAALDPPPDTPSPVLPPPLSASAPAPPTVAGDQ